MDDQSGRCRRSDDSHWSVCRKCRGAMAALPWPRRRWHRQHGFPRSFRSGLERRLESHGGIRPFLTVHLGQSNFPHRIRGWQAGRRLPQPHRWSRALATASRAGPHRARRALERSRHGHADHRRLACVRVFRIVRTNGLRLRRRGSVAQAVAHTRHTTRAGNIAGAGGRSSAAQLRSGRGLLSPRGEQT